LAKDVESIGKVTGAATKTGFDIVKVGWGVLPVVLGGVAGGAIGAGIGTFVGERYMPFLNKSDKDMVKILGFATTVDLLFEAVTGGKGLV